MYTGTTAEIPVGQDGLTGTKNLATAQPSELIEANNITYENGTLQKEGGAIPLNATPLTGAPRIIAGHDWMPDPATQRTVVFCSDGKVLKDSGGGTFATTLATGLTATGVPNFLEGGKESAGNNRKLILITGKDTPQYLSGDGIILTAFTSVPADWTANKPVCGAIHEARAWYAAGHNLYYSPLTDHTDVNGASSGVMPVYPGEGAEIRAIASFRGALIVWKYPRGVYFVDTSSNTIANWRVTRISSGVGIAGPRAWASTDADIIFVDESSNIQLLSAVQEFGSVTPSNLSQQSYMRPFIENTLNTGRTQFIHALYYPTKRQVHFAWSRAGQTTNNSRLVIDLMRLDKARFRYSDRDVCESLWLRLDSNNVARPASGDATGTVWLMDQSSRTKNGAGYAANFKTSNTDLSFIDPALATKRKNGDFLELVVEPKGNWNASVDIIWDGLVKQTVTFNMGTNGAVLGGFTLGTDALGGDSVLNKRKRITGSGVRFSMNVRNSGAGEDFSIARAYLSFRPADEKK